MTVYCVFDCDGGGCSSLEAIFATEDEANSFAQRLKEYKLKEHTFIMQDKFPLVPMWSVDVVPQELGATRELVEWWGDLEGLPRQEYYPWLDAVICGVSRECGT